MGGWARAGLRASRAGGLRLSPCRRSLGARARALSPRRTPVGRRGRRRRPIGRPAAQTTARRGASRAFPRAFLCAPVVLLARARLRCPRGARVPVLVLRAARSLSSRCPRPAPPVDLEPARARARTRALVGSVSLSEHSPRSWGCRASVARSVVLTTAPPSECAQARARARGAFRARPGRRRPPTAPPSGGARAAARRPRASAALSCVFSRARRRAASARFRSAPRARASAAGPGRARGGARPAREPRALPALPSPGALRRPRPRAPARAPARARCAALCFARRVHAPALACASPF